MEQDMTSAAYFDKKWIEIIGKMPQGGPYRFDLRRYGYDIVVNWISAGARVFDFACGLSVLSKRLVDEKQCSISGCDISGKAIEYSSKIIPGGDFRITDKIFGSDYKYVVASYILEHLEKPVEFIRDALTVSEQVICLLPNNFLKKGEHINLQWSSWESFAELFKDFIFARIDINRYPKDLKRDFCHPIVVFTAKK